MLSTTSLIWSDVFSPPLALKKLRSRKITSPARLPSLIIRSTARRASSRFGELDSTPASQRRQALPLAKTPERGWFTPCAVVPPRPPPLLILLIPPKSSFPFPPHPSLRFPCP